jgi:hypothetical protein
MSITRSGHKITNNILEGEEMSVIADGDTGEAR